MRLLEQDSALRDYRTAVMGVLNEYGLEGTAILSLTRRTELVEYEPEEVILTQGQVDDFIYFLVEGQIIISFDSQDRVDVVGERSPVTLLGEISFFNRTPATATAQVKKHHPAILLRLSYTEFTDVINQYPQIKPTLSRIGEMRVISQMDGYASFSFFMDMIGWKRDRLAVNRALYSHLEDTILRVLLPRLDEQEALLDVGDGPGIVCEIIHEQRPALLDRLYIQATHLEDAIINPMQSYPSDFSRTKYLRETFRAITALQVFDYVTAEAIGPQFGMAARLLDPEGILLVIRLRLVNVSPAAGKADTRLLFQELGELVERLWPGVLAGQDLIKVGFVDADIDPMMEWNQPFCKRVVEAHLQAPAEVEGVEETLLHVLLEQARQRVFNPEEILFHWLAWHALRHGLILEASAQNPEVGFFYQLFVRQPDSKRD